MGKLEIISSPIGEERIYWGDGKTPNRRKPSNGRVIVEKLPAVPHRKYVNPAGHIINLSISCAAADPAGGDYGTKQQMLKGRLGFVPVDSCPLADRSMLRWFDGVIDPAGQACDGYVTEYGEPKKGNPEKPCKHMKALITARQEANAKSEREFAEGTFRSEFLRQTEAIAGAVGQAVEKAMEAANSHARKNNTSK